ncbi:MAG TPA: crossover junction endodeoxyribonuclease RuvC [Polyangiaceae bacterium]|nr:crossover junction endodeoxyribonuclease RuvC [Polyangiaceae bacterium]
MLTIGIDPGTLHLGWGLVLRQGTRLKHVAHGIVHLPPKSPLSERLLGISQALSAILAEHRPAVSAVESLFFHKDPQAAAKLGHARGVVLLCLQQAQVPLFEYAPARVKRTIVGNGQAEKRQVALMVRALLGLSEPPAADAADALAIAITHLRVGSLTATLRGGAPETPHPLLQTLRRRKALSRRV